MAKVIDNPMGRRMIRLSVDDVLAIVATYQQKCNCKNNSYEEIRRIIKVSDFYLPEEI